MPLEGGVEIVADGRQLAGSRSRPLLRGPFRSTRFEASPIRCLVVDIPAAVIADAAILAGFTHLGRFSAEYHRRFGELPSQTLLRGS